MELLLIGGLAFLGYEVSKNGKTPSNMKHKKIQKPTNEYPFTNDPRLSNNPANMNMNTMQPFFRRVIIFS